MEERLKRGKMDEEPYSLMTEKWKILQQTTVQSTPYVLRSRRGKWTGCLGYRWANYRAQPGAFCSPLHAINGMRMSYVSYR